MLIRKIDWNEIPATDAGTVMQKLFEHLGISIEQTATADGNSYELYQSAKDTKPADISSIDSKALVNEVRLRCFRQGIVDYNLLR